MVVCAYFGGRVGRTSTRFRAHPFCPPHRRSTRTRASTPFHPVARIRMVHNRNRVGVCVVCLRVGVSVCVCDARGVHAATSIDLTHLRRQATARCTVHSCAREDGGYVNAVNELGDLHIRTCPYRRAYPEFRRIRNVISSMYVFARRTTCYILYYFI